MITFTLLSNHQRKVYEINDYKTCQKTQSILMCIFSIGDKSKLLLYVNIWKPLGFQMPVSGATASKWCHCQFPLPVSGE